jgi:hypothetical protein
VADAVKSPGTSGNGNVLRLVARGGAKLFHLFDDEDFYLVAAVMTLFSASFSAGVVA